MGIIIASTVSGISSLQKYDDERYNYNTDKLAEAIESNSTADKTYIDLNFAVQYFKNTESAVRTYKLVRSACISNAVALSSVMSQGDFDISLKNNEKIMILEYGEHSRKLRQGLRLFKAIGIRLPDSFSDISSKNSSESVRSVFLPIAGRHNLIDYLDLRYDSDSNKCRSIFLKYLESTNRNDNHHSRYYVPLIINLIRALNDSEFRVNTTGDHTEFLNEFIKTTKRPSNYRYALGYGVILAVIADRITSVENEDETRSRNDREERLKERLSNLLSKSQARNIINPYLHDNRLLSHKTLSALVKFNLV